MRGLTLTKTLDCLVGTALQFSAIKISTAEEIVSGMRERERWTCPCVDVYYER